MFLYAICHQTKITRPQLEQLGLGHIKGRIISRVMHSGGPDGAGCLLVAGEGGDPHRLRYEPENQVWQKSESGLYYVGFWNDLRPTETMLRRGTQIDGNPVVLDDGDSWMIPCARVFVPGQPAASKLPFVVHLKKDKVEFRMKREFVEFSEAAEALWEHCMTQAGMCQGQLMEPFDQVEMCSKALFINYHIGPDEMNLLEIITTANVNKIGLAIVDYEKFYEHVTGSLKKK